MFPRQRLYEPYQGDQIIYEQIGGNPSKITSLLGLSKLDEITTGLSDATKSTIKNMDIIDLANPNFFKNLGKDADQSKLFEAVEDALKQPTVADDFAEVFKGLDAAKHLPPNILNKMPDDFFEGMNPLDFVRKEGMNPDLLKRVFPEAVRNKEAVDAGINVIKNNSENAGELGNVKKDVKLEDEPDVIAAINKGDSKGITTTIRNVLDKNFSPGSGSGTNAGDVLKKFNDNVKQTIVDIKRLVGKNPKAKKPISDAVEAKAVEDVKKMIPENEVIDLKATGKPQTTEEAKKLQGNFFTRNKNTIIGTSIAVVAVGGLLAFGGIALDNWLKQNNAPFKITGMEFDPIDKKKSLWLLYQIIEKNNFKLSADSWILLKSNNAFPEIPNEKMYKILEVNNDARKIKIELQESEMPTKIGDAGEFLYQTTFDKQLVYLARDIGKTIVDVPANVAGGVFDGILESLGLTKKTFLIGTGVFVGLIFILIIIFMVMSSKSK